MSTPLPDHQQCTEHLAVERTFLAWVRTSIAIISLGFVVANARTRRSAGSAGANPPYGNVVADWRWDDGLWRHSHGSASHGVADRHKDQLNADLLAFLKA